MSNDPNQFSREAWDANAEHWDSRMGDEGNDFFNIKCAPNFGKTLLTYMLHYISDYCKVAAAGLCASHEKRELIVHHTLPCTHLVLRRWL